MNSRHIEGARGALPYTPNESPLGHGPAGLVTIPPVRPAEGPGLSGSPATGELRRHENHGDRLQAGTRVLLLAFTAFTLLAAISLLVLGGHTDTFFAWTIRSRPNASFLGAAYVAGFVLSVLALRQHSWIRVRVAVVTVTAFTILTLISTLEHLHRLHLMTGGASARLAAWVWLGVYLLIPVAGLTVVVRQQRAQRSPAMRDMREVRRSRPGGSWRCSSARAPP